MTEWPDPPAASDPNDPAGPRTRTGAPYGQYTAPGGSYPPAPEDDPEWTGGDAWTRPAPGGAGRPRGGRGRRSRGHGRLILTVAAIIAVLAGSLTAALTLRPGHLATGPHGGGRVSAPHRTRTSRAAAAPPPAITRAAAREILATYITRNNTANRNLSGTELAQIEGASALRLDDGGYQFTTAEIKAGDRVTFGVPITDTQVGYYIPRLPQGTWPRWFVTEGTWVATSTTQGFTPVRGYDVFSQASATAPWLDVNEPDLSGATPAIATDSAGYATAVSPSPATGLAAAPAGLPAATAAQLDANQANGPALTGLLSTQDQKDEAGWRGREPAGVSVTVRHSPTSDPVYALRLRDGGALAIYAVHAQLTLTAPAGQQMTVMVPGYYSPGTPVPAASMPYEDEFAVTIPPEGPSAHPAMTGELSSIAASG